jgi:hypothetical protein
MRATTHTYSWPTTPEAVLSRVAFAARSASSGRPVRLDETPLLGSLDGCLNADDVVALPTVPSYASPWALQCPCSRRCASAQQSLGLTDAATGRHRASDLLEVFGWLFGDRRNVWGSGHLGPSPSAREQFLEDAIDLLDIDRLSEAAAGAGALQPTGEQPRLR